MHYISSSEARAAFAEILAMAQKEPIVIQRQSRDIAVMISPEEYQKLRQLKQQEITDICTRASAYAKKKGLTGKKLAELLSSKR